MVIAGKQAPPTFPSLPTINYLHHINHTQRSTLSKHKHSANTTRKINSNMFPQPDAETLARNPQFALLWKDLTTNKITRDGVSKSVASDKETVKVRETLKSKQIEQAKVEVLKDAVRAVAFGEGEAGLVGEVSLDCFLMLKKVEDRTDLDVAQLRETAQIVSAQMDGKLDAQDEDIVQVEVEEFMSNIETVRAAVETHMEQNVMLLCQVLGKEENERVSLNIMLIVQKQIQHSNSQILRQFQLKSRLYRQRSKRQNGS
jgi:hypothetical protein